VGLVKADQCLKVKWAFAYPTAQAVGQPTIIGNRLYVTTNSGQVICLNAQTGCAYWAINVGATVRAAITVGSLPVYGPAGAAIWSAPTLDLKRGALYVGTGNSYTDAPTGGPDANIAFDLKTGQIRWVNQVLPNDNFISLWRSGYA